MKYTLVILLIFLFTSCNQSPKSQEKKSGQMKSSHDKIYENTSCLDLNDKTTLELAIEPSVEKHPDSIHGKAFFSSGYFRKLAICNGINYKLNLNICNKDNRPFFVNLGVESDTVYFSIPYDSLQQVMDGNEKNYLIKAILIASYNNGNEEFGYDTSKLVKLNVKR